MQLTDLFSLKLLLWIDTSLEERLNSNFTLLGIMSIYILQIKLK